MRIAIGSDHGGFALKEALKDRLVEAGHQVLDQGTHGTGSVDYPDFAAQVARKVATGEADRGVMIDGAGVGSAMTANKVPGVRAACANEMYTARNARGHNDANVLTMGSMVIGPGVAWEILRLFLETDFEGGRHQGRVDKIMAIQGAGPGGSAPDGLVRTVVSAVLGELSGSPAPIDRTRRPGEADGGGQRSSQRSQRGILTEEDVRQARNTGQEEIVLSPGTVITPLARDTARDFKIRLRIG